MRYLFVLPLTTFSYLANTSVTQYILHLIKIAVLQSYLHAQRATNHCQSLRLQD